MINNAKAMPEACLLASWMDVNFFTPWSIVLEVLEYPIGRTLEVDNVGLATNPKAISDNILDPHRWLYGAQDNNTVGADISKRLAHLSCDVAMSIPHTVEKHQTLAVIILVDLSEVSKEPPGVGSFWRSSNLIALRCKMPCFFFSLGQRTRTVLCSPAIITWNFLAYLFAFVFPLT